MKVELNRDDVVSPRGVVVSGGLPSPFLSVDVVLAAAMVLGMFAIIVPISVTKDSSTDVTSDNFKPNASSSASTLGGVKSNLSASTRANPSPR